MNRHANVFGQASFSRAEDGDAARARFHEATLPEPEHWTRLQDVLQRRVLRYFRTHGLLDELDAFVPPPGFDPADPEPVPDHASRGALQFDQSLPDDFDD